MSSSFYQTKDPALDIAISIGKIQGNTGLNNRVFMSGYADDVSTTEKTIWADGGADYVFPTVASTLRVTTLNANDVANSTSTGGRTVRLTGLDANYEIITEDVNLAGVGSANTTKQFIRVNNMRLVNAGSFGHLHANATAIHNTANVSLSKIRAGDGQSLQCVYTVANNSLLLIDSTEFSVAKGQDCTFRVYVKTGTFPAAAFYIQALYQQAKASQWTHPLVLQPKSDIFITAKASAGSTLASATVTGILHRIG